MKEEAIVLDEQKLRGGYYTPKEITDFICSWAIREKDTQILEPSCGDGNFVEACINRLLEIGVKQKDLYGKLKGIELFPKEAKKASLRANSFGLNSDTIVNSDFFNYISKNSEDKFDVVVGNPPFIRYQNFPEEHRAIAIEMMRNLGLSPNKLTNIWVPFLVIGSSLLKEKGRLGMVIPAELFQVKYAGETRVFLSNFFERITIITFKKLVFDGIQQEVILLLCEKKVNDAKGIRTLEVDHLDDLKNIDFKKVSKSEVKIIEHSSEKWTKYFLNKEEIELLRKTKATGNIPLAKSIIDCNVGIVTGRNEFFMMKQSQVKKRNLSNFTNKVVSKSNHLSGIIFNDDDYQNNSESDLPNALFLPPDKDFENLPNECKEYIKYGEENKFHTGYKCRIRKNWYITPSLWNPAGFALRQVHGFPKLVLNRVDASSTDTIHRVKFISEDYSPESITVCFLNSLTFAFSEITGRSYGGGVLTFEPTEIKELLIPVVENHGINLTVIDDLMRNNKIENILDIVDKAVLIDGYGYSQKEVNDFRNIWKKMSSRRMNRGKSVKSKKK